jgi:hypothetical protein
MRGTRGRIVLSLAVAVLVAAAWAPVFIAERYADGPGGAEVGHARLDRGWEFLYHAVRLSRGAGLGSDGAALETARKVWAGPPAVAQSVRLVYMDGPFEVPVPEGGLAPAPGKRVATPASRLGWVVEGAVFEGRVRRGERQMIGMLDYASGRVTWDITPFPAAAPKTAATPGGVPTPAYRRQPASVTSGMDAAVDPPGGVPTPAYRDP